MQLCACALGEWVGNLSEVLSYGCPVLVWLVWYRLARGYGNSPSLKLEASALGPVSFLLVLFLELLRVLRDVVARHNNINRASDGLQARQQAIWR